MEKITGAENIRWNLVDLFKGIDDPAIQQVLTTSKSNAEKFQKTYKGRVAELSAQELAKAYLDHEEMAVPLYKVSQFASLTLSTDTSNHDAKALESKIDDASSEIENLLVFFELELGHISKERYEMLKKDPALQNYAYLLERSFENAKYNLSEKEEQVINLKDLTGIDAHKKLYEEFTSAFEFEFTLDGKLNKMNGSELRALRQHENKDVRRSAMKLFLSRYEDHKIVFEHLYNQVAKDFATEINLRGYPKSAISVRNLGNDLSDEAVQALHDATSESTALVSRYYKLKAKLLNLPDMTLADIYAPMPKSSKKYSYEEAKQLVLDGFKAFDEEFYSFAKLMFDQNRIDAPVLPKKRGGAFCSSSTPDVKPYVLLNFLGRQRDVSTMAHELGHAIHDMYCEKQTLFNYHPILPLAETASVFSEMIITDLLLKQEGSREDKIALLTDKLEDIFATSFRQNMFSRFEMQAHGKIAEGLMSHRDLCDLYQSELKLMFGDSVTFTPEYQWEWAAIPHIYNWPFYVYSYNFGNLLVMALYQKYKEEGQAFIPKLKAVLAMGSAANPTEITAIVGADITSKAFWKKSMTIIEGLLKQLEDLV